MRIAIPFEATAFALTISLIVLSGCAGGGGGNSSPPPPFFRPVPFTSFSAVEKRQEVVMQGMSDTLSATINGSTVVTGITGSGQDASASTLSLQYDDSATLPRPHGGIKVATPSASLSVSIPPLDAFSLGCDSTTCSVHSGRVPDVTVDTITVGDPAALGWNYQTFGVWRQQPTASTLIFGAISAGVPT